MKRAVIVAALGAAALLSSGCMAEVGTPQAEYADEFVAAAYVPADIYDYPHVAYDDGYAYFVDGQWYYPEDSGWVVFQREPEDLRRYRREHFAHAADARRHPADPVVVGPAPGVHERRTVPEYHPYSARRNVVRVEPGEREVRLPQRAAHAQLEPGHVATLQQPMLNDRKRRQGPAPKKGNGYGYRR